MNWDWETAFKSLVAVAGSIYAYMFDGLGSSLLVLIIAMVSDVVSGVIASKIQGVPISSKHSYPGLLKKSLMLLSVMLAVVLGRAIPLDVMQAAINVDLPLQMAPGLVMCWWWTAHETLSVTENMERAQLPLPRWFKSLVAFLQSKSNGESAPQQK